MATFIYPQTQVSVPGVATEATLLQVEQNTADTVTELQTANTELQSISTALADVATETTLASAASSLTSIDGKLTAPLAVTGPLTDAELRATAVPVSGPLTDTQLRNAPIEVNVTASVLPTDAATEATLAGVATEATVSTLATEVTLEAVEAVLDNVYGTLGGIDGNLADIAARTAGSLVPLEHDSVELTYVTSGNGIGEIETVSYKLGVATVATLTLTYDSQDRLQSVVRT